jgi:F-type H+-transporting ATPase subunit delta
MRATPKQYAKSFFEVTKDASEPQLKKIISNFAEVLVKNNETAKIERIVKYFNSFWNKDKGIIEAEVISRYKLDAKTVASLQEYIKKDSGQEKVVMSQKQDESIIGGIIVKYGDKILDSSLRTKLFELKNALEK